MDSFIKVDLHLYSFILCGVMLSADMLLADRHAIQNRLFRGLVVTTMVLLAVDLAGVYTDGLPECLMLSTVAETLLFVLTPLPACIWVFYVSCQLFQDMRRLKIEIRIFAAIIFINAVLGILSPIYGLVFRISPENVYERGPLFFVLCVASFLPMVYSMVLFIARRKKIPRKLLAPLLLFPLPPIIASVMQILMYGISVIGASITISIFIICVGVQVRQHNLDHLTGASSRSQFDSCLAGRIRCAKRGKAFSCIMLDIDNFKAINDTFGHVVGDDALLEAAGLLRSCIRGEDFLARYVGDEFIILLDMAEKTVLDQTVARIHARAKEYNRKSCKPYSLDFSVGYEIYDETTALSQDQFVARVDSLMYENKNKKKESLQA
jgi:diguanylate cyclase (GGDEF)-like protein